MLILNIIIFVFKIFKILNIIFQYYFDFKHNINSGNIFMANMLHLFVYKYLSLNYKLVIYLSQLLI